MKSIYLVSEECYSGVSVLTIGLAAKLKKMRVKTGYMKPFGYMPVNVGKLVTDIDAPFMWELLGIKQPLDLACPVVLTPKIMDDLLNLRSLPDFKKIILKAFSQSSKGKDAFLFEGALNVHQGRSLGLSVMGLADLFDTNVILVEKYDDTRLLDKIFSVKDFLCDKLKGVIINLIPEELASDVKKRVKPYLEKKGIEVIGTMPDIPILHSINIKELSNFLGGKVLCAHNRLEELVEGVTIGAMTQEHALSYFRRRMNQVVITGGDRSEIQVAALETGCRCIILTGNISPSAVVLGRSEEQGVPMIVVNCDTMTAAHKTDWLLSHAPAHEDRKVKSLLKVVEREISFKKINNLLGLRKKG